MAKTVSQVMTSDHVNLPPTATLVEEALAMRRADTGDVILARDGQARGIVTDRAIVIRGVAEGLDPSQATLGDIASEQVLCVTPGQDVADAVRLMRELAVRRLPVVDEEDRVVGIVSLGDLAIEQDPGSALADISSVPPNP